MPLIIEDGTGRADANAYDSVDNVIAYLTARDRTPATVQVATGEVDESGEPSIEEQSVITDGVIIQATQNIDNIYEQVLCGQRANEDQALAFPRVGLRLFSRLFPSDMVPQRVKNAMAEMCALQISGVDVTPILQAGIKRKLEKVDVIEEETEFAGSGVTGSAGILTAVVNELRPFSCDGSGAFSGIVRRW